MMVKQVSEFEKDEIFDPNTIAVNLIDKSKENLAETKKLIKLLNLRTSQWISLP